MECARAKEDTVPNIRKTHPRNRPSCARAPALCASRGAVPRFLHREFARVLTAVFISYSTTTTFSDLKGFLFLLFLPPLAGGAILRELVHPAQHDFYRTRL